MAEKKYVYRVKPGQHWGPYSQFGPGSTVELTQEEAEGFRDILEVVKDEKPTGEPILHSPVRKPEDEPSEPTNPQDAPADDEKHLATLTAAQLKSLPEWDEVEPPRPTSKSEIVKAILEVRRAKEE